MREAATDGLEGNETGPYYLPAKLFTYKLILQEL